MLRHIWNGRSAKLPQLGNSSEQLIGDKNPKQGSTSEDAYRMQDGDTAEVLLERLGYKVFIGGMYSVEDYRAM